MTNLRTLLDLEKITDVKSSLEISSDIMCLAAIYCPSSLSSSFAGALLVCQEKITNSERSGARNISVNLH